MTDFNDQRPIKLSVILPCLNESEYIATQLESLAKQNWNEPWEVIVSDNGSTDETLTIVEQYRSRLPNLKVVDASARRGVSFARNMGIRAAHGELLAFCDADDEVAPDWVAAIAAAISKYGLVASRLDAEKLSDPAALRAKGNRRQRDGLIKYSYVDYLSHADACGLGVRRSIHEEIGGFDETMLYCEDCDYCWRAQLSGTALHFAPEALVYKRHQSGSVNRLRQARNWGEYNVLLNKKFRPLGMPKVSFKVCAKIWWRLLKRLRYIRSPIERERWLWDLGYRLGHLKGSLKYRIIAL